MRHTRSLALLVAVLTVLTSEVRADLLNVELLDHGGGSQGTNYGLRIDNGSVQTFSFSPGVFLDIDTSGAGANTGRIFGTVQHNQGSNQLWDLEVALEMHLFTNFDGSNWNTTDSSGDLYDEVLDDFIANARNESASGESNLKSKAFAADRIGFEFVELTMTLQGGQGAAEFTLPGQTGGVIDLFDYPQDATKIPFILAKGHRLATDEIAGFGWLDPTAPSEQTGSDGLTQDFLFRIGDIPPPDTQGNGVVPEPASLVVWGIAGLFGVACFRRRLRKAA